MDRELFDSLVVKAAPLLKDNPIGHEIGLIAASVIFEDQMTFNNINDALGVYGYLRSRKNRRVWKRVSMDYIEPYRKPEPINVNAVETAVKKIGKNRIAWKDIPIALGMHPTRKSVNDGMRALGWTWKQRQRVWVKE